MPSNRFHAPSSGSRAQDSSAPKDDAHFESIVGASARMRRIFRLVAKVAATDSTVLLLGESGTGKELIARSIHLHSRRSSGPFVAVNVGALPGSLIEAELFGHRRGAFTGAQVDRHGLIEEADHGTLFLDEIGDMPLATQVQLLRVLENSEVRRLGENVSRHVDVRVVAATHHDLMADVQRGAFREDLYYRLNVVQIELPPLRERREDIGLLAAYFLERTARRWGRGAMQFSPDAMTQLEHYDYPGNVRELENAIEHAAAIADTAVITPLDLPVSFRAARQLEPHGGAPASGSSHSYDAASWGGASAPSLGLGESGESPARTAASASSPGANRAPAAAGDRGGAPIDRDGWSLAEIEKEHIRRVLERHRGNATSAARQLGISRTTLWRKLRAYGLVRRSR
ncbi:MAG: sigma-54 interaction domain-containing protein [Candidatus Eiseniibacteriota bacterium]